MRDNECMCGCGEDVKTVGSLFRMGHDAKHKANLIRRALDHDEEAIVELDKWGWTHFLDKRREVLQRPRRVRRRERREKKVAAAAATVDVLFDMRKAGERLKAVGRYSGDNKIVVSRDNYLQILQLSDDELATYSDPLVEE